MARTWNCHFPRGSTSFKRLTGRRRTSHFHPLRFTYRVVGTGSHRRSSFSGSSSSSSSRIGHSAFLDIQVVLVEPQPDGVLHDVRDGVNIGDVVVLCHFPEAFPVEAVQADADLATVPVHLRVSTGRVAHPHGRPPLVDISDKV